MVSSMLRGKKGPGAHWKELGWVTEQVWIFWTGDKSLNRAENRTPMPQSSHYADYVSVEFKLCLSSSGSSHMFFKDPHVHCLGQIQTNSLSSWYEVSGQ
jgi:hypothetical protein